MSDSIFFSVSGGPNCPHIFKDFLDRGYTVHAGDMNKNNIGPHLADHFVKLPPQDSDVYFETVLDYVEKNSIDYFVPLVGEEALSATDYRDDFNARGCALVAANKKTLKYSVDTEKLFQYLMANSDIPLMNYEVIKQADDYPEVREAIPHETTCVKPVSGAGTRGFTILMEELPNAENLFTEKHKFRKITHDQFEQILKKSSSIPKLLYMEFLDGPHHDSNIICRNGDVLFQSVRTREESVDGTITQGEVVKRPELEELNRKIAEVLNTTGLICTQFIGNKLIEINPRWSTSLNNTEVNEYEMGIQVADDIDVSQPQKARENYFGTRMIRYWDIHVFEDSD